MTVSVNKDSGAGYTADNVSYDGFGCASFDVIRSADAAKLCNRTQGAAGRYSLKVPGAHNIGNALAAIALAEFLGIDNDTITKGFLDFTGTDRRFQYKGKSGDVTIVDDYAHHPTEIRATLSAAANYPHKRIVCIFQPHTYSRTKAFFDDFADALTGADVIILAPIYAARETDTLGVSSDMLCEALKARGKEAYSFSTFEEIEDFVRKKSLKDDLLITMGAGDVVKIGEELLSK